jgi:hypothetical protein
MSASNNETDFAILDEVDFEPLPTHALAAAVQILTQSRPETVEAVKELLAIEGLDGDDDMLVTILRRLGAAAAASRSIAELIETAQERLFAACSAAHIVIELEPRILH